MGYLQDHLEESNSSLNSLVDDLIIQCAQMQDMLKRVIPFIENLCDEGPDGFGWQSDELMKLITDVKRFSK